MELKFNPDKPKFKYVITQDELNIALEDLEKQKAIGVDIESSGLDPFTSTLLMVQLGTDEISYIIDTRNINLKQSLRYKELLENTKIIKILHNAKFDYKFIKHHTNADISNIYDTMLAEGVLTAGLNAGFVGLKTLVLNYLGLKLDKSIRTSFEGMIHQKFTNEQLEYGALDTLVLFPIFQKQLTKMQSENIINVAKLEFATTKVVAEMEYRGIYIDKEKWQRIIKELKEKRTFHANNFFSAIKSFYNYQSVDLFGASQPPININSQAQLLDLFNNKLKLNLPSTGDPILADVKHPVAAVLREYRKYEKLISAFGESLLEKVNPVTNRLHPDFNQLGAATGRFSCNNPNLQQIPRNSEEAPFRECFNPISGYKLVVADYSSFEMRILADLSNDMHFIKALNENLDLHSFTASLMFGLEYTDDFKKKYPEKRQAAKAINFGLMYGMGPGRLAAQIDVSKNEASEMMEKYFQSYPSVRDFLNGMAKSAVKNGWSSTPAGRKRWYKKPSPDDPEYKMKISSIERQAKNHPIQGTNADAIKYALVFLHERFKKEGVDGGLTHTVHDEIVSEVREDQAEYWSKIQSEEMVRAAKLFINKVPIVSDPFVGDVWEH